VFNRHHKITAEHPLLNNKQASHYLITLDTKESTMLMAMRIPKTIITFSENEYLRRLFFLLAMTYHLSFSKQVQTIFEYSTNKLNALTKFKRF